MLSGMFLLGVCCFVACLVLLGFFLIGGDGGEPKHVATNVLLNTEVIYDAVLNTTALTRNYLALLKKCKQKRTLGHLYFYRSYY